MHTRQVQYSRIITESRNVCLMLKLFEICRVTIQSNNEWTSFIGINLGAVELNTAV